METELLYVALVAAFNGLLWVPYILGRVAARGLVDAVGYPTFRILMGHASGAWLTLMQT